MQFVLIRKTQYIQGPILRVFDTIRLFLIGGDTAQVAICGGPLSSSSTPPPLIQASYFATVFYYCKIPMKKGWELCMARRSLLQEENNSDLESYRNINGIVGKCYCFFQESLISIECIQQSMFWREYKRNKRFRMKFKSISVWFKTLIKLWIKTFQ